MKRLICVLLTLALLLPFASFAAKAESSDSVEENKNIDGIFYGAIRILRPGDNVAEPYRAARDKDGKVYIHYADYARIIGATMVPAEQDGSFRYYFGNWYLTLYCKAKGARLCYCPGGIYEGPGVIPMYGDFSLDKVIYRQDEGSWYLPLEELFYMSLHQWRCRDGMVVIWRPENLLDVVCTVRNATRRNPDYYDYQKIMGSTAGEVALNSFRYGMLAIGDEVNLSFIVDIVAVGTGFKEHTEYEKDFLRDGLLLLADDSAENTLEEANVQVGSEGLQGYIDFASTAALAMGVTGDNLKVGSLLFLAEMGAGSLTESSIFAANQFAKNISTDISLMEQPVDFIFNVGNALWVQQSLPDDFQERLAYIQKVTQYNTENEFASLLYSAAGDAESNYCGSILDICKNQFTIQHLFGTLEAGLGVRFGTNFLTSPMLILSVYDFGMETAKTVFPEIGEAFQKAEDVQNIINLLSMYSYMGNVSNGNMKKIVTCCYGVDQELLNELRLGLQITQNSAMHAHAKLADLGAMNASEMKDGMELLQRLSQAQKHDGVLTITKDFADLYNPVPGSIRECIPPEYVYGGDGIFLSPVYQVTEAPEGYIPIETEEDFLKIADNMAGNYILMADLEFDGWTPLGSWEHTFTGILEGNGHSITINFRETVDLSEAVHGGIFDTVSGRAIIQNLHIKGDWYYVFEDKGSFEETCVGSICSYIEGNARIFNCVNSANITSNTPAYRYNTSNYIGGLVGYGSAREEDNVRISYCRNFGKIQGQSNVGGIICVGLYTTVYACQNDGEIDSGCYAGGIVCSTQGVIENCANRGKVTGYSGQSGGISCSGGRISNSINVGDIFTEGAPVGYSGGISGRTSESIRNCISLGSVGRMSSAICCSVYQNGSLSNCYWLETLEILYAAPFSDGAFAQTPADTGKLTAEELTVAENFEGFDFRGTWTLYAGMACPYPSVLLLNGQVPPMVTAE